MVVILPLSYDEYCWWGEKKKKPPGKKGTLNAWRLNWPDDLIISHGTKRDRAAELSFEYSRRK